MWYCNLLIYLYYTCNILLIMYSLPYILKLELFVEHNFFISLPSFKWCRWKTEKTKSIAGKKKKITIAPIASFHSQPLIHAIMQFTFLAKKVSTEIVLV